MSMKKRIAGIFIVCVVLWFMYEHYQWQKVTVRCINYNPEWRGIVDCYGIISISSDDGEYFLGRTTEPGPIFAYIKNSNAFTLRDNDMYFVDVTPKGICNNLMSDKYCANFQVKGESKNYYYDTPEEVPTYIIIDTQTGDERFYAKIEDAPAYDQMIFRELLEQ